TALGAARERGPAEGDALVDGAVVADLGGLADDDAHAVVDEDAAADLRAGMDLDAGEEARDVRDPARHPVKALRAPPGGPAMHHDRVQAGVTRQHLPRRPRGRIAFTDA